MKYAQDVTIIRAVVHIHENGDWMTGLLNYTVNLYP